MTVHAENINCVFPEISVYGDQSVTEHVNINTYVSSEHFMGSFKQLKLDVENSGNGQCKYLSETDELWPYVYVKVFNVLNKSNVKVCEVVIF